MASKLRAGVIGCGSISKNHVGGYLDCQRYDVVALADLNDTEASATGTSWFGFGPALVIGVAIFLLGVVLMFIWRAGHPEYWRERPGVAPEPQEV